MSALPPKVLCVGRIYCDLVFSGVPSAPQAGEEVYADDLSIFAGGGAYITAAYLAAAGVETSLCGILPSGPFGAAVGDELTRSGVDISLCQAAAPEAQPQVTVVISSQKDRAFLTRRSGAALPENIEQALADPNLQHLHIAELATLVERPELVRLAKAHGLSISVDCSWDDAVLSKLDIIDVLVGVDVFLPSEPELFKLTKADKTLPCAAKDLARTVPLIAVKRGALGASLWSDTTLLAEAVAQKVLVVDPTGAGDAFNAGFLSQWLKGADYVQCIQSGNTFGAAAIGWLGGASAALNGSLDPPA